MHSILRASLPTRCRRPFTVIRKELPPPAPKTLIPTTLPHSASAPPWRDDVPSSTTWKVDGSGLGRDPNNRRAVGCCCSTSSSPDCPVVRTNKKVVGPPSRPGWYEELYAKAMERCTRSYEAEIAGYKAELFGHLQGENKKVLELGVGTGPNLKFYAKSPGVAVFAVDPMQRMEKYAQAAAVAAGLPLTNFTFLQGVGEDLPLMDDSMDAVIGTQVLCSVQDIDATIREVKRVLKPGGVYIFIEHVAAAGGSLRLLQTVLNPLQQWAAYGCHLTRETGKHISDAGFSDLIINRAFLSTASIMGPHVYGIACK